MPFSARLSRLFYSTFICLFAYLFIGLLPAHAQYSNPYTTPNTDINVPANLHTYTQSVMLEVLAALTCQITGRDPISASHLCLGVDTSTGKIGYIQKSDGGAIGFVNNMISDLYTPPIHTADYVRYIANNFGFAKHTYAASTNGIGFDQLTPLLSLWTTFRNISYFVFVLIFVAIGFAIMLRVKIDPRTVMTIENQIPKILIGLILVTFSYAIAGFLIDMMYVSTYLTVNVITGSQSANSNLVSNIHNTETKDLSGGNPLGFANDIIPGGVLGISFGASGSVKDIVSGLLTGDTSSTGVSGKGILIGVASIAGSTAVGAVIGSIVPGIGTAIGAGLGFVIGVVGNLFFNSGASADIGKIVLNAFGVLLGVVAGLLAFLIIAIALLVALFRLWFTLLLNYVNILLEIVLAPFFIIAGVFPGSKIGFGSWLKSMIGNLLAFPVTVGMFLLAGIFMNNFAQNGQNVFVPPLIGNPSGGGQSPVAYLIALGMILLTPNVVQLTRGLVGAGDNKALGGIFQSIGVGSKTTGGIFKRTTGAIFGQEIEYDANGQIKPIKNPVSKLWRGFVQRG